MDLDTYQQWTRTTAIYDDNWYPRLALAEEVGEFLGKIAKYNRDNTSYNTLVVDMTAEAGDILWQLARCLDDMGISMQEVLDKNVEKINSRKERQVLSGSGDNR